MCELQLYSTQRELHEGRMDYKPQGFFTTINLYRTMLDTSLETLNKLRDQLNKESCLPKEPFMKLGAGNAPTLNYNLPQSTCFSTYGDVPVELAANVFKPTAAQEPPNNYFQQVERLEVATLQQQFSEAVQLQNEYSPLMANVKLLRKNINVEKTNLEAIAVPAEGQVLAQPKLFEKANLVNEVQLAKLAKEGSMPVVCEKFGGFQTKVNLIKRPPQPTPRIYIIEEYKTCSFLGDYGAGRTVQTFSLLPGEKTTITVRTYRDKTSEKTRSENLLDSFSESSADEMERFIEEENSTSETNTTSVTNNVKVDVSVSAKLFKIVNASVSAGYSRSKTKTSSRTANSRALNRALNKHVAQSNSSRNVEVNTSTSESIKEGEEHSTIREIENINKSRVLNFVFRQLLQEYISITYLANIRIVYTNGYMESVRVVDLEDLNSLLEEVIMPDQIDQVTAQILKSYCRVLNYRDTMLEFIERMTVDYGECLGLNEQETFWRRKQIEDVYTAGGLEIRVPGVILEVQKNILRTPSLVVDALLGQGEALDCFNMKAQDAVAVGENLNNLEHVQKMEIIESIGDPAQQVEQYKKVFGPCCNTPQQQV